MRSTSAAIRLLLLVAVTSWAIPDATYAQQPRSLDEELLDELNTDPLDEFDRELFGPGKKQGRGPDPLAGKDDTLADRLRRELGAAADPEDGDPLLAVARKMRNVEGRIAENDSGPATCGLQQQIVTDLDKLIQELRARCRACKPGDGKQPGASKGGNQAQPKPGAGDGTGSDNPARISNAAPARTTPRRPDMKEMERVRRDLWGVLPQRDRQQVMQLPAPKFLPKYELLTEEYFRRLAEQKK